MTPDPRGACPLFMISLPQQMMENHRVHEQGASPIGSARVSTVRQGESLEAAGCDRVFVEEASGVMAVRPGLGHALDFMREDDELAVVRLDRLGRSAADTMTTIPDLDARGVRLLALDFVLDTASPSGRLVVVILVQLAQWERDLLIERTHEGLAHARAQGRVGGRPPKLTAQQVQSVRVSHEAGMSVQALAEMHGVSRWTIVRAVREGGVSPAGYEGALASRGRGTFVCGTSASSGSSGLPHGWWRRSSSPR